ncbi:MAG: hypothetical protein UV41_C0010G0001 [Candidatus Daviesbacteria bacterium GW2011_GWA2_42_7]|uniref:Uncharacterized protein n=1 Tax=Candidatus Daviesbacteria bacterium GW2011_GWA2_42_7 TaxID=1618425 RepID=A0A0G1BBY9_9BACT|nr:MAG: hypothetical protein UV41_C0010G0001 [Candidatus Daviesbacteria bacterium GW2011_GWA2_42_7]
MIIGNKKETFVFRIRLKFKPLFNGSQIISDMKLSRGLDARNNSWHVLNVYERTGHDRSLHTLESMDACRVSWGKVYEISGPHIKVVRRPLKLEGDNYIRSGADARIRFSSRQRAKRVPRLRVKLLLKASNPLMQDPKKNKAKFVL